MKLLILVAGMPATGKTTLVNQISEKLNIPYISKDIEKEKLFDLEGFKSREEKVLIDSKALNICKQQLNTLFKEYDIVLFESNFRKQDKLLLNSITTNNACQVLTVLLTADINVAYQRFIARNHQDKRHLGHIVNDMYPTINEVNATTMIDFDTFKQSILNQGINDFKFGNYYIEIDMNDLSNISIDKIIHQINQYIKKNVN